MFEFRNGCFRADVTVDAIRRIFIHLSFFFLRFLVSLMFLHRFLFSLFLPFSATLKTRYFHTTSASKPSHILSSFLSLHKGQMNKSNSGEMVPGIINFA